MEATIGELKLKKALLTEEITNSIKYLIIIVEILLELVLRTVNYN